MTVTKPELVSLDKIGFDLDGTLDRPEIAALCRVLFTAGVEVHIITVGAVGINMETGEAIERTPETIQAAITRKIERLEFLSIPYHHLHVVMEDTAETAGQEKASLINYYNLPIMIDDSPEFVQEMVADTTAMILHLKPGGNQ